METRSRKRVQASEQCRSPPADREKKKPNISSPSSATPTPQHRYPIRRLSQATIETNEAQQDCTMPTQSKKKRMADNLIIQDTAQQRSSTQQTEENAHKPSDKGKEKEKQPEVKDKGKEKEIAPHRDDVNPRTIQATSKVEKMRQVCLGGSYGAPSQDTLMQILSGLTSGDEFWQMQSLTNLCEVLCMGNENTLSHFPARSFVAELVKILNNDYNPELMLLAARALTQLCDALPTSCHLLVNQGAVPYFCGILQSIQYIDVAEQSLQALFKISREHPGPCLRAGGLNAVLSNFEFYSTGVQRVAVSTAANMCRRMPEDAFNYVNEALPILTHLLQYPDTKVVEHASLCLIRVAESFATSWEKLDILCMHGLIPETVRLLSADHTGEDLAPQTSLSSSTYMGLVRLLSICANGSSVGAESLLEMNISSILRDILTDSGSTSSQSISTVVMNMPSEQLSEIVNLINVLLPRMPQPLVSASQPQSECARLSNSVTAARKQPLCDKPNLLSQFGADLFPVLVQVFGTSLNLTVRSTCLDAICKLVHFSTADMLRSIFQDLNISSFLVGVLASKDPTAQISALQIAELLMQKLPDYFTKMFIKEGVLQTINTQFGLDLVNASTSTDRSRRRSKKVSNFPNELENMKVEKTLPENDSMVAPSEEPKKDIRSVALNLARNFKETYFRSNSGNNETAISKKLKKLCSVLRGDGKMKGKNGVPAPANDETMADVLVEILTELGKGSSVSTFEFVGCGVIESLLYYFSCGNLQNEKLSPGELRQKALERLQNFFEIVISCNSKLTEPLLVTIIRKLQSALASIESFPVQLTCPPTGNNSASRPTGLNALAHPLKLQFFRNPEEKDLRDFPSTIVVVSPLTTLSSVEHYLWPHVRNSDAALMTASPSTSAPAAIDSRPLTRSKLNAPMVSLRPDEGGSAIDIDIKAASKLKGKEKVDQTSERKGPETRSAAERRRQAANILFEASTEVEDEEVEFYRSELEETFTTDEDEYYSDEERDEQGQVRLVSEEESTLCNVYEVVLGDNMPGKGAASAADERSGKRVTASTSASGRGVLEDGMEGFVVVPGASSLSEPARLCFSLRGKACDRSWTVLKAIRHTSFENKTDDNRFTNLHHERWIWDRLHTFDYQQAHSAQTSCGTLSPSRCGTRPDSVSHQTILLHSVLQRELPCDLEKSSPTYNILLLLYILEKFQNLSGHERAAPGLPVPGEEFLSSTLMPKLSRQMQDGLALCSGNLPAWCDQLIQACPFLFSFESRRQYFHLTAFGLPRALHRLQQQQSVNNTASLNERETRITRLRRRKVRISRDHIFESAMKVMDLFSNDKGVLEVEYFGEVGTGLGPTLEFYTLLSQELQKASLGMWRSSSTTTEQMDDDSAQADESNNDFVYTPYGLFPRPLHRNSQNLGTTLKCFRLLGQVVGKALQDGRLLDLPLSKPFYKLMLNQELDLYDMKSIDLGLGNNLEQMHKVISKKGHSNASKRSSKESRRSLRLHNTKIEELYLTFTLPGYPEYVLKPGGENIMVDSQNLEEYIALVVDASVKSGIFPQMDAFRAGFNQIFPISTLQIFNEEELSYMLCGLCEMWQPETLVEHLRFDHGYNASSPPIKYLLEIMGEFNPEQQRAFLQFVTGAPQLPCGGLSALRPKLTIVRKLPNGASGETSPGSYASFIDGDLPSVMTCANYLKLPPYSCKDVMLERLLYAIHEGQGSFDLS